MTQKISPATPVKVNINGVYVMISLEFFDQLVYLESLGFFHFDKINLTCSEESHE
jgi:hypothetical protein